MAWSQLTSMELDDESKLDASGPMAIPDKPDYPYGLRICLTAEELAKLDLAADCQIGDLLHFSAMARVTSMHMSAHEHGGDCRIELQIEMMSVLEDEDKESDD